MDPESQTNWCSAGTTGYSFVLLLIVISSRPVPYSKLKYTTKFSTTNKSGYSGQVKPSRPIVKLLQQPHAEPHNILSIE